MAITLEKLCEGCEAKYQMELMAGRGGIQNTVRWVHMVEDREVPDFLHGNELVFTTGIGHISGEDRLTSFVRNLKERDASGVVINIGPYISYIPPFVLEYCDQNDFPIFTLPWKVHIIDITYDFCSRIIENEKNEVSLADAFRSVIREKRYISEYNEVFSKSGFTDDRKMRIAAMRFFRHSSNTTERLMRNNSEKLWRIFRRDVSPTALYVDQGMLILIQQQWDEEGFQASLKRLEKSCSTFDIDFYIGVSNEKAGLLCVPELFQQATAALLHGETEEKQLTEYKDIGLDKLICAADSSLLRDYVEHSVGAIKRYDEENGTNLCEILRCYTENDGSIANIAQQFGVHRNTINYQIGRAKKLFSLTFSETEKAELALAFRILKLNEKGKLL